MAWMQRLSRKNGSVSYKVYWRDPIKKIRTETYRTRAAASRRMREIEHDKDVGTYVDPNLGKVTLAKFWDHFIRTAAPASPSTAALYALQARRYLLPRLGNIQLRAFTKPMVRSFLADLHDAGVGPASINSVYRLLRRVLTVAVDEGRIPSNPASRIQVSRGSSAEKLFLTPEQVADLAEAVDARYETLIYFLAYTGARIGEAAALRVKNVDLMKRQARIVEASKEVEGRLYVGPTKNKLNRSLTLPRFLAEKLADHLHRYSNPKDSEALVFSGPTGKPIRQNAFRRRFFKPAAARAGLPDGLRPHDLRHTAVALAIRADWHPKQIQEMLGHSSIEVTLGTYGHLFETLHGDGADRMDALYHSAHGKEDAKVLPLASFGSPP